MNAIVTVIPVLLLRYGLLDLTNRAALKRAALFAPLVGREMVAYWIYQAATVLILVQLLLLEVRLGSAWSYAGLALYGVGLILYAVSLVNFARPGANGMGSNGLYRISRNPMYVALFISFLGVALLAGSWTLLSLVLVFQLSAHWIILSEERWCIGEFGEEYRRYMSRVRRYI